MTCKSVSQCAVIASIIDTDRPCSHQAKIVLVTNWLKDNSRILPKNLITMNREFINHTTSDNPPYERSKSDIKVSTTRSNNGFLAYGNWYRRMHPTKDRDHYEDYITNIGSDVKGYQIFNKVITHEWKKLPEHALSSDDSTCQSYWIQKAQEENANPSTKTQEQKTKEDRDALRKIWKTVEKVRKALAGEKVTALLYLATPDPQVVPDYRGVTNAAALETLEKLERNNVPIMTHLRSADAFHRYTQLESKELTQSSELITKSVRKRATETYKDRIRSLLVKLCEKHHIALTPSSRPPGTLFTRYQMSGLPENTPALCDWRKLSKEQADCILSHDTTDWELRLIHIAPDTSLKQQLMRRRE